IETRTVDVHIAKLRRKIAPEEGPSLIETVRGAGYRPRPGGPSLTGNRP
ncbi:MAG: winged helix-turn-helix domain-containing protein, partial [Holophagales bacterium]|nr:winged helix-turn-helix domain-containing protein [Holophagales bacterium]